MLFWSQSCLVLYLICFPLCPYSNSVYIFQHFIAWVSMSSVCCFHRQHFHSLLCFAECLANSAIEIFFSPWLANSCWLYHTFCAWPLTHGIWFQDIIYLVLWCIIYDITAFCGIPFTRSCLCTNGKVNEMIWPCFLLIKVHWHKTIQLFSTWLIYGQMRKSSNEKLSRRLPYMEFFLSSLSYRTILI